ncbi:penicillin-binding protein 1B [Natronocella acetinitrilica]|uniref:Penicillin-binding protein 1B n=1 Tax=Natronocella acetinitrilica TaxID=414046 RepID=A0AAE3KBS2_9GAMM|nr:penicillin-binding protein 1B [Natronocella acetinitrilica]MCP1674946.1 penicillin-binding protein 1B [Natronocella acetinitrilica]
MNRPRRRPRRSPGKGRRPARKSRLRRIIPPVLLGLVILTAGWLVSVDRAVQSRFEGVQWTIPATVYARPLELHAGLQLTRPQVLLELDAMGYHESASLERPGTWRPANGAVELFSRRFAYWDGDESARRLRLEFGDGRISRVRDVDSGAEVALARLDPARIGSILPSHREDRLLVRLGDVPPTLIAGLIVVEDRGFFSHLGLSPSGIARAALANLRARRVVQGGSTLTQQLAKNFYLSRDQTLWRKLNEAVMAVIMELRYDKEAILEAYLNEVYLAQAPDRAIHGMGLASYHYFGQSIDALSLEQQALLVALVRGPSRYHPYRHPERAMQRRNLVLDQMAAAGVASPVDAERAKARPLGVVPPRRQLESSYPAFMTLVQRHLQRDYRREDLQTEGLRIFTTLSPSLQASAERALATRLENLPDVEGAVVLLDPQSGEVQALVGGKDPRYAGFNRALDARRQIGSLVKPLVYLTALEQSSRYGLGTVLPDEPLTLEDRAGSPWEPRNYDRQYRGPVLLVEALAHSYNLPAIHLGIELGLQQVARTGVRLGVPDPGRVYPAYLLGTQALTPLEVAELYQVFASGGYRTPARSVRAVTRQDGSRLNRYPLAVDQVAEGIAIELVNAGMQAAVQVGTARGLRTRLPGQAAGVAGKTGTTDDGRDSWFAGFSADRLAVVWVGRDDNQPTELTGASGGLPVWADIMADAALRPYIPRHQDALEAVWIDRTTGLRSDEGCTGAMQLPYRLGAAPDEWTDCGRRAASPARGGGWLRGLFR